MKKLKRLVSMLLTLCLIMGMSTTAFASNGENTSFDLTILEDSTAVK